MTPPRRLMIGCLNSNNDVHDSLMDVVGLLGGSIVREDDDIRKLKQCKVIVVDDNIELVSANPFVIYGLLQGLPVVSGDWINGSVGAEKWILDPQNIANYYFFPENTRKRMEEAQPLSKLTGSVCLGVENRLLLEAIVRRAGGYLVEKQGTSRTKNKNSLECSENSKSEDFMVCVAAMEDASEKMIKKQHFLRWVFTGEAPSKLRRLNPAETSPVPEISSGAKKARNKVVKKGIERVKRDVTEDRIEVETKSDEEPSEEAKPQKEKKRVKSDSGGTKKTERESSKVVEDEEEVPAPKGKRYSKRQQVPMPTRGEKGKIVNRKQVAKPTSLSKDKLAARPGENTGCKTEENIKASAPKDPKFQVAEKDEMTKTKPLKRKASFGRKQRTGEISPRQRNIPGQEELKTETTSRSNTAIESSPSQISKTKNRSIVVEPAQPRESQTRVMKRRAKKEQSSGYKLRAKVDCVKVCTSGFDKKVEGEHELLVEEICRGLGGLYSAGDGIPKDCTHLVLPPQGQKRTFNVAIAIARGLFVVNYKWITESMTSGSFVDEEPFEAVKLFPGCRVTRELKERGILSKSLLYGQDVFVDPNVCNPGVRKLQKLTREAHGRVIADQDSASLVINRTGKGPRNEVKYVRENWLFDFLQMGGPREDLKTQQRPSVPSSASKKNSKRVAAPKLDLDDVLASSPLSKKRRVTRTTTTTTKKQRTTTSKKHTKNRNQRGRQQALFAFQDDSSSSSSSSSEEEDNDVPESPSI